MASVNQVSDAASDVANVAGAIKATTTSLNGSVLNLFGYNINIATLLIIAALIFLVYVFIRVQKSQKLDFTDMLTFDGRKVSTSKVLQLLAGLTSTWFVLKTGLNSTLSPEIFGIYLVYAGSVEGFSKFMQAKYNYSETSVKDASVIPPPGPTNGGLDNGPVKVTTTTTDPQGTTTVQTTEKGITS